MLGQSFQIASRLSKPDCEVGMLSMPKALTASLPIFDGKSEKNESFEGSLRNNPHLNELKKLNYFHPHVPGNALNTNCNFEDTKKGSLTLRIGKSPI